MVYTTGRIYPDAGGVDTPLMGAGPLRLPPPKEKRSNTPLIICMVIIVALSIALFVKSDEQTPAPQPIRAAPAARSQSLSSYPQKHNKIPSPPPSAATPASHHAAHHSQRAAAAKGDAEGGKKKAAYPTLKHYGDGGGTLGHPGGLASKEDEESQRDFSRWIDREHGARGRKLKDTVHHQDDLSHSADKGKGFGDKYGQYLDKQHPSERTLHGRGIHPDTLHPVGTTASSGSSFDQWLDSNYPPTDNHAQEHVSRGVPAKGRKSGGGDNDDVDKTGSEHFHRGWYRTHNLHSSLNSGHRGGDGAGDARKGGEGHEEETEREEEREREREREREQHDLEVEHAEHDHEREQRQQRHDQDVQQPHQNPRPSERETHREHAKVGLVDYGRHLNLHQRTARIEGREGGYVGLSPMERAAHLELDKIEAARKERAKASLSLKQLTATMRRVQGGRGPTRGGAESGSGRGREGGQQEAPGGFLSNYNLGGKVPNPNGVLTEVPEDRTLAGGVLANVKADTEEGGALAKVEHIRPDSPGGGAPRESDGVLAHVK